MLRRHVLPATLLSAVMAVAVAATAAPAGAADLPVSQSRGFFLSGAVGGTDLATVAQLADASAVNTGGASVTSANPLSATLLGQLTLPIGQQTIPIGSGLKFGVLNQYAQANPDGSAVASSGAVADNGAIQSPSAAGTAGNMSLDLQALAAGSGLPSGQIAALGNATLSAGALAGQANRAAFDPAGTLGAATGTYQIGSLGLTVSGPTALTAGLSTLTTQADTLIAALTRALAALNPVVSVTLPPSSDVLKSLTTVSGEGFSADLSKGTLTLDLRALIEKAAGQDINKLPPNTPLLPLILQALPGIATAIGDALTAAGKAFIAELGKTSVTIVGQQLPVTLATLPGFDLTAATQDFTTALDQGASALASALGTLGTALSSLLSLTANVQSTAADQTFTETALAVALLPSAAAGVPTALQLNLGSASVGPGAPLPVATTPPATTTPVSQPPTLANTGPFETMGTLALGAWAVAAGLALMVAANAARRSRLLHVGSHRS